ncbi:MAG: glutamate--tRNA ligase [Escherichia coli]|nr:MAG: glutamate--tRNA ligase [Escherichia coli]
MSDYEKLAELLFPQIDKTPEYYENLYPKRDLKEGAVVTRFAPSPTGYLHFGGLYAASAEKMAANSSDGVFFLRIEDTDKKREVENGVDAIVNGLNYFGISADEGVTGNNSEKGNYGPYTQSKRAEIYQTFAKDLVKKGLAYPCFCTPEELDEIRNSQENDDVKGYYGKFAKCRNLTYDEIAEKIAQNKEWTLRLKSNGDINNKIVFTDVIKGKIEMAENVIDVVLLKTDKIPTYHFAHAVDDHLMRTTHVIRGDEWIASVPLHIQLFKTLGFKPVKYAHIAPILKTDGDGKRKLSKRKDPEAAVSYFEEAGYPAESVNEYIATILNSNFEDWRRANKTAPLSDFPFKLKKMSVSGALFDMVKLEDVSKNTISVMSNEKVFELSKKWAEKYSPELLALYEKDNEYAKEVLNIDRNGKKPRKDIAKWSEIKDYISYFYDETFEKNYDLEDDRLSNELAFETLEKYKTVVDSNDDKDTWFSKIKDMCADLGCTPNVKEYKANPENFRGHVGDLSTIIRVALTGRKNTPDLHAIIRLLGTEKTVKRIEEAQKHYTEGK